MTTPTDAQPARTSKRGMRLLRLAVRALAIGWLIFFWVWLLTYQHTFVEVDAEAYWGLDLATLYQDVQLGDQDAFLYSPVVAWLFAPFSLLPYDVFYAILAAVNLGALVYLLGFELAAVALFLVVPVSNEVARGNIHLLMGAAIVIGFRYSAAWSWILLTKVTPGIGVFWFAMRREWRALAIALGTTAVITLVSFLIAPDLWIAWVSMLAGSSDVIRPNALLQVPLPIRLAAAAILLTLAAWRNRPAALPVVALIALPAIWVNSLSLLAAVVPLWRHGRAGPSDHSNGASTHLD